MKDVFGDARLVARLERDLDISRLDMSERLREKDRTISFLADELLSLRTKSDRMELALMPFASRPGAAYAGMASPRKAVVDSTGDDPMATTDWQKYRKAAQAEIDEKYAAEQQEAAGEAGKKGER